jgi:hypothetical protein
MAKCCPRCFNDKLIAQYIEIESQDIGECSLCRSVNVKLVEPEKLTDAFEMLLELYKETSEAYALPLPVLMQRDWEIFANNEIAEQLVPSILSYTDNKAYSHKNINELAVREIWQDFKKEVKHNNRFFPKSDNLDMEDLKAWVQETKAEKYPRFLYRARICENNNEMITVSEMGKPPFEKVSGGRANPIGISYLYVATNKKTAISEVRPHKGDFVTIAKIKILNKLKLADLRNPKKYISPFARPDNPVEDLFKYIELLQHLGEELSKPILPRQAQLEYLPSQYLAELIKDAGFDGVIYKSSVGSGDNIALFDDKDVKCLGAELYEVKNLTFESAKIQ